MEIWKFLAGLGLFLYGMKRLEKALERLAGRGFKIFLKKYTTNPLLGVLIGFSSTAILQSSSLLMLLVIAFAGANIITLESSLGIILGANIGTTMTGWIVSTLGFKFDISQKAYPMLALGALGQMFFNEKLRIYQLLYFFVALGLLLIGLDYMKEGMVPLAQSFDLPSYSFLGPWVLFVLGAMFTALIQSSSAMMAITLSALYTQGVTLEMAIPIMIGADLGTTCTGLLASFRGSITKKKVAMAHLLFNISTAILALSLQSPILNLVKVILGDQNQLYLLVGFHSAFNIIGVFAFLPFLKIFKKLLEQLFTKKDDHICQFIFKVPPEIPDAALEATRLELYSFVFKIINFSRKTLCPHCIDSNSALPTPVLSHLPLINSLVESEGEEDLLEEYEKIKKMEEEILRFFTLLQKEELASDEAQRLNQFILGVRNGVQSAKAIKDIEHNLKDFSNSVGPVAEEFLNKISQLSQFFYKHLEYLCTLQDKQVLFGELSRANKDNEKNLHSLNEWVYQKQNEITSSSHHLADFLNVNREIFLGNQFLILTLKDVFLNPTMARDFSNIPN